MTDTLPQRIEAAEGADNALDVLAEIALFTPDDEWKSVRANAAGTKVIYKRHDGGQMTCLAFDWTRTPEDRKRTAAALRAKDRADG